MAALSEHQKRIARVLAKSWSDPKYKERLTKDPHSVLLKEGFEFSKETKIHVHFETPGKRHIVIPPKPAHLKVEDLADPMRVTAMASQYVGDCQK